VKLETIVVATDFSEASKAALELGTSLAGDGHARLLIVHVEAPEITYVGEELDGMVQPRDTTVGRQLLQSVLPGNPAVPYEHHLLTGTTADEIVQFAHQHDADLIVLGTHGRSGAMRLLLGSVAESVVRHASCPVLTVKQKPVADG
jgi:nucleotide-binding universal stress UspA family protein